ncbi:MAG: hypothetical protein KF817_03580 [Phycisphaeraceae bacterium]|nr:hypothetical protein [Phycisphaeraceae bacterium]
MPLQEQTGYIKDSRPDLTTREKNAELGARLQIAPWNGRDIVSIHRLEIRVRGWEVRYRTGSI